MFRTRATVVELDALRTKMAYQGAPRRPDGVYDLLVDGRLAGRSGVTGGNVMMVDMATRSAEPRPGPVGTQLHPDAATHRRIGERFAELAFGAGGTFAAQRA
ncbi:hypothetical protein [Actinoallomurus purpureus]|uniref:hypothetical protein n=1 Tax=Actinoallomurus purpureus TaxID=478114 RepID=UPI00355621F6